MRWEPSVEVDPDKGLSFVTTKKRGSTFSRSIELSLLAECALSSDPLGSEDKPKLVLESEEKRRFRFTSRTKTI